MDSGFPEIGFGGPNSINKDVAVQPTNHKTIRKNQIDGWQELPLVNNPIVVSNARDELPRDNFFESRKKKRNALHDGKSLMGNTRRESPVQGRRGSKDPKATIIKKSVSVPANLKGLSGREKSPGSHPSEEGILKRSSSSFLASVSPGKGMPDHQKFIPDQPDVATLRPVKTQSTSNFREYETDETRLSLALKRYSSFVNRKISFGSKTLSENCSKTSDSAKKSVSFSSDTGLNKEKKNFRRTAIHEAKVYKKGVLQDRSANDVSEKTVSLLRVVPFGGRQALLRAAREADDETLRKMVTRIEKFGLSDIDVNFKDSSGRTAVSYLAGNGSTAILEIALSFPGIDPNIPDNEGNTPLHFAAQAGHVRLLRDPYPETFFSATLRLHLCRYQIENFQNRSYSIKFNVQIRGCREKNVGKVGMGSLTWPEGQTDCLNILLQRCLGIEVDTRNNFGFTPLMKASIQGRTKCAKILLFAGANPTLRDHGRGLRSEQWARFCGRYVCAEVIERFTRHHLLEKPTSCRWGSEPELAAKVLQGKVIPSSKIPHPRQSTGLRSRIKRVFRTNSGPDHSFSLVSQLTSAALCASSAVLPKPSNVSPVVKTLLNVPQLRVTLVAPPETLDVTDFSEQIEKTLVKPPRAKKKSK